MDIIKFIKEYWVQLIFFFGYLITFFKYIKSMSESTRCSLRNDILEIYDRCKNTKKITHYQLESIQHSAELYFKLNGNSFVKDIVRRVNDFELID